MNDQFNNNVIESLLFLLNNPPISNTNTHLTAEKEQPVNPFVSAEKIQSAHYLIEFANAMPGGFFIYHADDKEEIIYANTAMLRIFNCDTMEEFQTITGNSFKGVVHPDDLEAVEQSIKCQIENSQYDLDYVEYRIIQKGGKIRWVEDYGHFVSSQSAGDIFYVFLSDSTEKKKRQLEEMALINQEHLRRLELIEGLSIDFESIFFVDLNQNRIKAYRVNERFEKLFSKENPTREFIGFDSDYIKNWVHPDDRKLLKDITDPSYIREKLSLNKTFHINFRTLNNKKISYIQLRIVNVSNGNDISQVILGYRNIDDDMIQQLKQKQILEQALEQATKANNAKNLFLSNMSHDIRTPMNAILGFTSLVRKHSADKEKLHNYLNLLEEAGDQLLQLLNAVLELSRIESGKIQAVEKECSLIDIVQRIQTHMLPRAAEKNLSLSVEISGVKHAAVYSDEQKLRQILSFLVDNAIKYNRPDGWVTITVAEKEKLYDQRINYLFVVEDNGIGIDSKFLPHIFEPFEREKNTTLSGIHGTGLGLTITKDLVNILNGTIDISSVPDKGSKVTITLPLRIKNHPSSYSEETSNPSFHFSSPKRILIVDDNEINREIECEALKDVGFLVDTATDGSIAVEKVKQSQPGHYDLILMDIQMPVMNGYQATKAIRNIANPSLADIPIIAVSANTFEEDKKKSIESGMNAHLGKPLDTPLLYQVIQKFLKDK